MVLKKGMTLTEVIMAVALTALCIGGILAVIIQWLGLTQSTDNVYIATNIARSRIEKARGTRIDQGYINISTLQETDTLVDEEGLSPLNGNLDFKRSTAIDTATYPGLTKVTVSVKYKRGQEFNPTDVMLVTILSQYTQ